MLRSMPSYQGRTRSSANTQQARGRDLRGAQPAGAAPDAALAQAEEVLEAGYSGIYLDANAIAPASADGIAGLVGDRFVDGGIIGPPAEKPGTTRLYLSGPHAAATATGSGRRGC